MTKTDLSIPFNKKDELKQYKIKWDAEKKIWYFDGEEELPKELEPYISKYVDIKFEEKDLFKSKFKSMSFDRIKKLWRMSMEDYNVMTL